MKVSFVLLLLVLTTGLVSRAETILSFKDWKSDKIQQILTRINNNKSQIDALRSRQLSQASISPGKPTLKPDSGISQLIQRYQKQLTQEEWNLEVAQDLSITEYIMLHVGAQPSKARFQQAASKLAPQEVAELMEAYSVSLGVQTPAETIAATPVGSAGTTLGKSSLGTASPTASNLGK